MTKAQTQIQQAQQCVASFTKIVTEDRIKDQVDEILKKSEKIERSRKLLSQNVKIVPAQVKLLKSFNGILTYLAPGLLILIGNIERFKEVKKLASFFGLHPGYKKSCDGTRGVHMSKKGSQISRQILYLVSLAAIRSNPLIRELYPEKLPEGMKRKAAIGVCMPKILRSVYGMVKNNTPFASTGDHKNKTKKQAKTKKISKNSSHRQQCYDPMAPISRSI